MLSARPARLLACEPPILLLLALAAERQDVDMERPVNSLAKF